jgi:DNA-binding beta-propeller fold protein YncE
MRSFLVSVSLCSLCLGAALLHHSGAIPPDPPKAEAYRSPIDLAVLPGGKQVLTANHSADSATLVDLGKGKVLAEVKCGRKPVGVACARDGKRAAVSNLWSGTVTLLDVLDNSLKVAGEVKVGTFPRGLTFAPDGKTLYVAVAGNDEVVQLDWIAQKIQHRWPAPREPRAVLLSSDGRWLLAACSRTSQVRCWDTHSRKLHWERGIIDGFNLRGLSFTPDGQHVVCAHAIQRSFPVSKDNIDKGWVIDSRLTRLSLKTGSEPSFWQIALDTKGEAVGDPHGLTVAGKGQWLVLSAAGTHELLLLKNEAIPWTAGDPGDFLDYRLNPSDGTFRRVPVGGRPMTVASLDGGDRVVVANYLLDAVQVVDAKAGKVVQTIALCSAPASLARKGEALFYDARRSHNQWFSCNTCHVDGHTCCLSFDTLNDDSYGNPKMTPPLHNVTHTGPWTWHGWQKDLGASIEKSFTTTMFGPKPSAAEVKAVLAFLETFQPPPNPNVGPGGKLSAAAERGKAIFQGKAHCARCHKGAYYTSEKNYDLGIDSDGSPYKLWNPPSLLGLFDRSPYMHDGRAKTLDELLQKHHVPEKMGGQPLTAAERQDLIAFLKSL